MRTFILFHQKSFKQYGKDFGNASGRTRKNAVPKQERDEASSFLNLSKSYLYKLTAGNLIPHYKPQGKMLYFEKSELEAWLRQNPVKTKAQIEQEAQRYIMNHPVKR